MVVSPGTTIVPFPNREFSEKHVEVLPFSLRPSTGRRTFRKLYGGLPIFCSPQNTLVRCQNTSAFAHWDCGETGSEGKGAKDYDQRRTKNPGKCPLAALQAEPGCGLQASLMRESGT